MSQDLDAEMARIKERFKGLPFWAIDSGLPSEIVNCCLILGLTPSCLKISAIERVWKKRIVKGEMKSLTIAKDTLIRWLEGNPGAGSDPHQPAGVPRRPLPNSGSGAIALPEPKEREETLSLL
jgi:hypothetical protein